MKILAQFFLTLHTGTTL